MAPNSIEASGSDQDAVIIDRDDISNYNPAQILPQLPEVIERIRTWLQPTRYAITGGEYRKHLASHLPGTGAWLIATDLYRDWLRSDECGLLWIKGIPGSGKSVMAAKLVDELSKSNPGCLVLYFFFRQIIDANHKPKALLCDWMDQVLDYSPPLQEILLEYVDSQRSLESISLENMWSDLRTALAGLPCQVFCVADALDEMDSGYDEFLHALGALGQWRPNSVKVLITSRLVSRVERPLRQMKCHAIRLQEGLVDTDIATYVEHLLSTSTIPINKWPIIQEAVPGRANGLFLYAKLAMDAFLERGADVDAVLSELPADLNVLYTDLLQEHARRSGVPDSVQHLILQSVTHATRPLRLLELAEMIRFNSPDGTNRDIKATKDLVRAACGPLLEILPDETISVVHHSLTEYLKGSTRTTGTRGYPVLELGSTNAQLGKACLRYLNGGCLEFVKGHLQDDIERQIQQRQDADEDINQDNNSGTEYYDYSEDIENLMFHLRVKYPFFDYAVQNWFRHVNRSDVEGYTQDEINPDVDQLLRDVERMKAFLLVAWNMQGREAAKFTPLHVAAKHGLVSYTQNLLQTVPADPVDSGGKSPLWHAAKEGHGKVVRLLVVAGADPDRDDTKHGLKPLHKAASANHVEACQALLEAGVDPLTIKSRDSPRQRCTLAPTSEGHTPLMYACYNGHFETVAVFLPFLQDLDIVHQALTWASEANPQSSKIVDLILEYPGVNINVMIDGSTPLYRACGQWNAAVIRSLLRAGADPNIDCSNGAISGKKSQENTKDTCLHQLCKCDSKRGPTDESQWDIQEVFRLLIQAGMDVNQRHSSGETALHAAVFSPVLTKLLLDAGADANALNFRGRAVLHDGHIAPDSITLLVEHGHCNVNLRSAEGLTPLHYVTSRDDAEPIGRLLDYQADCNAQDGKGNTPLHLVLESYRPQSESVELLLRAGANVNIQNQAGLVPLHILDKARSRSVECDRILDLLQKAGADIDARDHAGMTYFFKTAGHEGNPRFGESSHSDLQKLLERGASPHVRDFRGRTCLHQAPTDWHQLHRDTGRFEFLLGLGLDPRAVDFGGNSLFHELAYRDVAGSSVPDDLVIAPWKRLLAAGLDLHQANHQGQTPLHILAGALHGGGGWNAIAIDFVTSHTTDFDRADHDGVTPLHIAVTVGTVVTKKLLDAGADPTVTTHEGLTPLHIAARCRKSNVVGLLLDALRRTAAQEYHPQPKTTELNETMISQVPGVNAKSIPVRRKHDPNTPLFYACRSGRPETVALLLDAGADPDMFYMLSACAKFAEEDELWIIKPESSPIEKRIHAPGVKLDDLSRPEAWSLAKDNKSCRLEEILEMLYSRCIGPSRFSQSNADILVQPPYLGTLQTYTLACLRFANKKWSSDIEAEPKANRLLKCASSRMDQLLRKKWPLFDRLETLTMESWVQYLREYITTTSSWDFRQLFQELLDGGQFHLVEVLARLGSKDLPSAVDNVAPQFMVLVRQGFTHLVDKVGTILAESTLAGGCYHAFGDKTVPGLWLSKGHNCEEYHDPELFLLQAVRRELPNMDVVKLLVEKFRVDVDEVEISTPGVTENVGRVDSPILHLARGGSWWHVGQALPYFISKGANLNVRNEHGQTPLHLALKNQTPLHLVLMEDLPYSRPFGTDAARCLIEAGADVNAMDKDGTSCLSYASHNTDMIRLLMKHGATVTAEAVCAVIDTRNITALEALLSEGVSPNIRRPKPEPKKLQEPNEYAFGILDSIEENGRNQPDPYEQYPLYIAASSVYQPCNSIDDFFAEHIKAATDIIQVLLNHGANPFAKFLTRRSFRDEHDIPETPSIEVPNKSYQECTVLHDLMDKDKVIGNVLLTPGLDVNHRDALGRTLLHVASLD